MQAVRAGVRTMLRAADMTRDQLATAVLAAHNGEALMPHEVLVRLLGGVAVRTADGRAAPGGRAAAADLTAASRACADGRRTGEQGHRRGAVLLRVHSKKRDLRPHSPAASAEPVTRGRMRGASGNCLAATENRQYPWSITRQLSAGQLVTAGPAPVADHERAGALAVNGGAVRALERHRRRKARRVRPRGGPPSRGCPLRI